VVDAESPLDIGVAHWNPHNAARRAAHWVYRAVMLARIFQQRHDVHWFWPRSLQLLCGRLR
jgi:hypothetical protein